MKTAQQEEAEAKMKSSVRKFGGVTTNNRPLVIAAMVALVTSSAISPRPDNKKHDWD